LNPFDPAVITAHRALAPAARETPYVAVPAPGTTATRGAPSIPAAAIGSVRAANSTGKFLVIVPYYPPGSAALVTDPGTGRRAFLPSSASPASTSDGYRLPAGGADVAALAALALRLDTHLRAHGKLPGRDWALLIVEQTNVAPDADADAGMSSRDDDPLAMNRGSLLNAGTRLAAEWGYDYCVMHDADALPLGDGNAYDLGPFRSPAHLATSASASGSGRASVSEADIKAAAGTFLGRGDSFSGAVAISTGDWERVNGASNLFWGPAWTDDMLRASVRRAVGFARLPPAAGVYAHAAAAEPGPADATEAAGGGFGSGGDDALARNNRDRFFAFLTRREKNFDGYAQLNATVLRYAPLGGALAGLGHWASVRLDTLAHRPRRDGWEGARWNEARRMGALPPLTQTGIVDGLTYVPQRAFETRELDFARMYRARALRWYRDQAVLEYPPNQAYLS
jgi:hypothetical protein